MKSSSRSGLLVVGPIPPPQSYVGGIAVLLMTQLESWELPLPVAHFNTELWAREFGETGRFRLRHLLAFVINAVRLSATLLRRRPAAVHFHTSIGLALAKDMILAAGARWIFGCKVVLHVHFAVMDAILLPRSSWWRRLEVRALMLCCDHLVLLSEQVRSEIGSLLRPQDAARFAAMTSVLPNFTVLPAANTPRRNDAERVNIFFIGNIGHRKGIYDLVRIAAQVKQRSTVPFQVTLAGPFDSPEDSRRLESLVDELGLTEEVRFVGTVAAGTKAQAFQAADVFALPSYGEGVPVSLIEALAYGLPVVVTNVGGIPETVTDGQEGFILRPGQIEEFAVKLTSLIGDSGLRKKMGSASRARAERCYSLDTYFKALRRLYSRLNLLPEDR